MWLSIIVVCGIFGTVQAQADQYITATAVGCGTISPDGIVGVDEGEDQSFTIAPCPCGWISELLIDGVPDPIYQGVSEMFIYTFEDVITDHTIQVNFQQTPGTITASAGSGGSISPEGTVEVSCEEDQSFFITSETGYTLYQLLIDDNDRLDESYQTASGTFYTFHNVITDHTIEASFQEASGTFTISGHVRTTSSEGIEGVLLNGFPESATTDSSGYYMVTGIPEGWSGTVTPQKEGYTFDPSSRTYTNVMADQSDQDYIGSLTPVTHMITATAGPGGSITPSGAVSVNEGEDQSFAITADDGYEIEDVMVDGVSEGPISTYTFTNVSTDHTIVASFTIVSGPVPTPTPPPVPTATPSSQPIPEPTTGILFGFGLTGLLILYFKKRNH